MNTNNKLKTRRQELHLTLEEVASAVGVARSTVKKWESGDIANMKRDKIVALADALQISPDSILGLDEVPPVYDETLIELGKRIKKRRLELNMTQDGLAQKAGYTSRSSINKIELGLVDLPQSKIAAIASALDVYPEYLVGWGGNTYDQYINNMGDIIRQLRLQKGVTQEELGKVIGVQKSAIRKYECGMVQNIKRSSIKKLAEYFNVTPSYLLGFDDLSTTNDSNNLLGSTISGEIENELITLCKKMNMQQKAKLLTYAYDLLEK